MIKIMDFFYLMMFFSAGLLCVLGWIIFGEIKDNAKSGGNVDICVFEESPNNKPKFKMEEKTRNNVFGLIENECFEYPKIVKAIAVLESGNFTSELFLKYNNAFGMMRVKRRATTQLATKTLFGHYESIASCVRDMKIHWNLYYAGLSEEQVYEKLQRQYAASRDYADKIKQIADQLKYEER
jgi:uncharacterized FlgJ-related protein